MSVQSDIELISIQSLENYAKKYHLSVTKTNELFSKHHVFEQIILQHEYLHQISSEEIFEFVESLLLNDPEELILYHGTVFNFDQINLSKSHNRRDFGIGFYTTLLESQAKEWAYRLSMRNQKNCYYVNTYSYKENKNLKIRRFTSLNEEWLEFIKENRSKGGLQHDYDIVIGPVADDNTMETIQLYIAGIITSKEAVDRLKYNKVNNQISFHTNKSLECLELIRRECYE